MKSHCHVLTRCVQLWASLTPLHGFAYLADPRSKWERLFWALVISLAFGYSCIIMKDFLEQEPLQNVVNSELLYRTAAAVLYLFLNGIAKPHGCPLAKWFDL